MKSHMLTTANPFDSKTILTASPLGRDRNADGGAEQVKQARDMVAEGYRDLPVTIERVTGHSGCGRSYRGAFVMGPG